MAPSELHDDGIPTEELFEIPSSGVFFDQEGKMYWIDPKTGYNCFMLFARDLSITWGDDERYWQWCPYEEKSDVLVDVAELKSVCWLEVRGKLIQPYLPPGIMYEVAFVMMSTDSASGWEVPVSFELTLPDEEKQEREGHLIFKSKNQWFVVPVGEFRTCLNMQGDVQFSLLEIKKLEWKSGLVIKGAIIRPKRVTSAEKPSPDELTVIAKDLSIAWGDDRRYWRWYCLKETSNKFIDVAELQEVCWLEAKGTINISKLSPEITYEVAFVVKLENHANGWVVPVNLQLVNPDGKINAREECIQNMPKEEWKELKVGEYKKCAGNCGEIQFSLFETESGQWKKGLVIKCVVIRPKN